MVCSLSVVMLDVVSPNKCGACGSTLLVYYVVAASILDTCGWKRVQHKIWRCGSGRCPQMGGSVGVQFLESLSSQSAGVSMVCRYRHIAVQDLSF